MISSQDPNDDFKELDDALIALTLIVCIGLFTIGGLIYWLLTL